MAALQCRILMPPNLKYFWLKIFFFLMEGSISASLYLVFTHWQTKTLQIFEKLWCCFRLNDFYTVVLFILKISCDYLVYLKLGPLLNSSESNLSNPFEVASFFICLCSNLLVMHTITNEIPISILFFYNCSNYRTTAAPWHCFLVTNTHYLLQR